MLNGKSVIVTGSTSGIGQGVAEAFAAQGCNILLNGFGDAKVIEQQREAMAQAHGIEVLYSSADMTKPEAIAEMVAMAEEAWGGVDIVVNNAGIQHVDAVEDFPAEKWDAVMAINLSSAFHTIQHAMPGMKKRKSGRIINIASAHGLVASANKAAYVSAKHGIVGLTKVVALETAREPDITCNAICPGWVLTPLVRQQIEARAEASSKSFDEEKIALLSEKQPSCEFVTVEEIGALAVYLAGDM
ncbi:MAG: 3-hydroxybutyrate dehydrogenase, partial [Rickettsiales bacterium]